MRVPPAKIHIPEEDRREILAHIDECLASGQLTLGKHGTAFEEAFAQTAGTKHAVAVSSGTSALEIIFRALGVEGGEVVVPTNTFFATPAAVLHAGGIVRFAECDPATYAIDVDHARTLINDRTRAVVVVHIGGLITPRIGELQKIKQFNLTDPAVKKKLQERYGEHIPLEEPVISSASMFESPRLVTVREK